MKREFSWKGREFSNESLDYLLRTSLRRTLRARPLPKGQLCHILIGWALNYFVFVVMQLVFISYGCKFAGDAEQDDEDGEEATTYSIVQNGTLLNLTNSTTGSERAAEYLLTSWLISVGERFLLAEPLIILTAFFVPICFASEFTSNICGESVASAAGVVMEVLVNIVTSLKG